MRSEDEMLKLIMHFIEHAEAIRAAVLNGSRAIPESNLYATRDMFRDFDVACYVRRVKPFVDGREFLEQFGDIMIMQTSDHQEPRPHEESPFFYLMQFADGNRIDLSFHSIDAVNNVSDDSLSVVLADKDNQLTDLPPSSERDYIPKKPTAKEFLDCCNEFFWVSPYVAKGLWRDELIYAKTVLDSVLRKQLMKVLDWHFGILTDFSRSPGKLGKRFRTALSDKTWQMLETTYSDSKIDNIWDSLFAMGDLFRLIAENVAEAFSFEYQTPWDDRVTEYLRHIRHLPKDAKAIF